MENSNQSMNISNNSFIRKRTESYKEVGDSWWSRTKNWVNNDWGKVTEYRDIFEVTKDEILNVLNDKLKENEKILIEELDEAYKTQIISKIEETISLLLNKLEGYQGEQSFILEERKKDNINLEDKKVIIQNDKEIIEKLKQRVDISYKMLPKGEESAKRT